MDQGSSVPLARCSFGMIPLLRHSVDRPPRAFHSSTHNVVRTYCVEVLSASVCAWQGDGHVVDVSDHLLGGSDLRCWQPFGVCAEGLSPPVHNKQGIEVAFKQPVIILHVSFTAISTCPVCLERPHEEQAHSAVEKQSANAVVRAVAG